MDAVLKVGAAAVMASALCLLLKRSNAELAVPVSVVVCVGAVAVAAGMLRPVLELLDSAKRLSGLSDVLFYPVLKSVGIGICTKIASDLCRDSGQGAMAGCVEMTGAVCAIYVALPLMETLLDMLEELA